MSPQDRPRGLAGFYALARGVEVAWYLGLSGRLFWEGHVTVWHPRSVANLWGTT
jgi:hypothetical protein